MASSVSVDHGVIRTGTPAEVAKYLRQLRSNTTAPASVTAHLHDAVARGSIPHTVFTIWTPLHRDADSIIAGLRQSDSVLERKTAIRAFIKALRSPKAMTGTWEAAGGAKGVAAIMSDFSVNEIRLFCNGLAKTASLPGKRAERHAMLTELVDILCADASSHDRNPDTRPLRVFYKRILPACTTDKVAEYEETRPSWSQRQQSILLRTHPSFYEAKFLASAFSPDKQRIDFSAWTHLINNNFAFAKELLSKFNKIDGTLPMKPRDFVRLAEGIAKRLRRRRSATEENLPFETLELLVQAFKKNSDLAESLNTSMNGVIFYVIKFWEHTRTTRPSVQQHLVELIEIAPESNFKSAKDLVALLRTVNSTISYRLFRLLIQSSNHYGFDIENASVETAASFRKLKGPWPADIFTMFSDDDPDASLRLFRKLKTVFPNTQFLLVPSSQKHSIVECPREPETNKGNPDILEALLVRASPTASLAETASETDLTVRIKSAVDSCKEKASLSRDWTFRLGWTRIAVNLSVAVGSLKLFEELILWARRFNKDRSTVTQLYSADTLHRAEIIALLSGIPSSCHLDNPKSEVRTNVESGNKVLRHMLETAAMSIREPSFQQDDWKDVLSFPSKVVESRLEGANDLQDVLELSNDEVFEMIWTPTVDFLIEAEKSLLKPGMQRLYPREIKGLCHDITFDFTNCLRPHSAKFLDTLAQERDALWREHRPQHFPAVHDLSSAWPQGLPVQYLCPAEVKDLRCAPFALSRIEGVVFGDPDVMLQESPNDKDSRAAIGPFVNDYCYALSRYVGSANDEDDRDRRIRKAWRHAIDTLSGERMTEAESLHFWRDVFAERSEIKLPHDLRAELPRCAGPAIPHADDMENPMEWNPEVVPEQIVPERREIPAKILDQMITHGHPWPSSSVFDEEIHWKDSTWLDTQHIGSFWSMERLSRPVSWGSKDGLFLAIMLCLNTFHGSDTSILKKPFPSETDMRYPPLYLGQDFMDNVDTMYFDYPLVRQTTDLIGFGPSSLIAQVARSVLRKVEKIEKSDPQAGAPTDLAMRLIRLLAGSDRPSLAFPLIRDVVLDRPHDSAWHRQLLNKGLFNKLPPSETRKLLSSIADGILEKLDLQTAMNKQPLEQNSNGSSVTPSLVKVTTVKMLAKLLGDAPFVDFRSSLGIFSHLLEKAKHIDICIAIMESLYASLGDDTTSPDITDEILVLLEKHAVPLAAAFNERGPPWASWEHMEAGEDLPWVYKTSHETPVRQIFATWDHRFAEDTVLRHKLAKMTYKVVEWSVENNQRWLNLFLKRYNFTLLPGESLPRLPIHSGMLMIFGRNREFLSRSVLQMMRDSVLAQIAPPPGIAAITKQIRRSSGLSESNAGKHWLSLFGAGGQAINTCGANQALQQMHRAINSKVAGSARPVTTETLQQFGNEIFESLVYGGHAPHVESLFRSMTPKDVLETDREVLAKWKAAALPVLEKVIALVEQLRTPQWQRDLMRKPAVLPDTFRMKATMTVFDFPVETGRDEVFVKEILGLMHYLAESKAPYHENWQYVKHKAFYVQRELRVHLMRLGIAFGSLDDMDVEHPTLVDHLRVDLAKFLVERGHSDAPKEKAIVSSLKNMLRQWDESPIEEFRTHARDLVQQLRRSPDHEWFTRVGNVKWPTAGSHAADSGSEYESE